MCAALRARGRSPYSGLLLPTEMAQDGRVPQNAGLDGKTIVTQLPGGTTWRHCKITSVQNRKRKMTDKAVQAAGGAEPRPKVGLQIWETAKQQVGNNPFPFFVDGETTVTTDDVVTEKQHVVDKPPVVPVPDHSLCCFFPHALCLVAAEIAAYPDAAAVTTDIRPCATHPGVFLHHRCMTMACHSMTTHSKRTFEDPPLGSFFYASLYCAAIHDCLGAGERGGFLWRMW